MEIASRGNMITEDLQGNLRKFIQLKPSTE